ncbi:MAG: polysaccharide deacetylase family protein [Acidobacteria bacterium]|nr:polysaccharide deacetylase family protein [Acidobacteriota bacterium]
MSGPTSERFLLPVFYRTQLYRAARRLNRARVVIAMYHGFTAADSHQGIENHEGKHVHVRAFQQHLAFLTQHYTVVPLQDVVRAWTTGSPLPQRTAVITIDDGYRSIYSVAYPALKQFQVPASVFLATDFVDNRRFLWTDRVEYAVNHATADVLNVTIGSESLSLALTNAQSKMAADWRLRSSLKALPQEGRDQTVDRIERAAGCSVYHAAGGTEIYDPLPWSETAEMVRSGLVSIGSHTHTHVIMSRCEPARAADELRISKHIIEERLGISCDLFCYPNGRRGDFNSTTKGLLKAHGFSSALTTVYGNNGPDADIFELRRYNLGKPMMTGEVAVRLSGLMELGSALTRSRPTRS